MAFKAAIDGIAAVSMGTVLILDWDNLAWQWVAIENHKGLQDGQAASVTVNLSLAVTLVIITVLSAATCLTRLRTARTMRNRSEPPGVLTTITS